MHEPQASGDAGKLLNLPTMMVLGCTVCAIGVQIHAARLIRQTGTAHNTMIAEVGSRNIVYLTSVVAIAIGVWGSVRLGRPLVVTALPILHLVALDWVSNSIRNFV